MSLLRVAVTQPDAGPDPRRNGDRARRLMRRAAASGSRVVLLPEGHLSGYAKEQVTSWADVTWQVVQSELDSLAALAAELHLYVVIGSAHPISALQYPYNSVHVIADNGHIVARYDKRLCSQTEVSSYYTPGRDPVVFEVDGYRFGIAVCIEINFPHLFEQYAELDVDCVLVPAYPVDAIFGTKAQALAAIYNVWVAVSSVGQRRDLVPSEIYAPDGSSLACVGQDDELAIGDLDRDDEQLSVALRLARPWRSRQRAGSTTTGG